MSGGRGKGGKVEEKIMATVSLDGAELLAVSHDLLRGGSWEK